MRACVTGAAGFIGTNLVDTLLDRGEDVNAVDNYSTGWKENIDRFGKRIRFLEGNLCDLDVALHATENCEVVFHQAALGSVPRSVKDPITTNYNNTASTINVMLAAAQNKVRRVIYASSASVYGEGRAGETIKVEAMPPMPANPYAVSKLAAEEYVKVLGRLLGVETVCLRYFNVFGPWQKPGGPYAAVVPRFIYEALTFAASTINGDGTQYRDFTYVDNVVSANILAASATVEFVNGRHFNVGAGGQTSVKNLYDAIRRIVGLNSPPATHGPARLGDIGGSVANISAAKRAMGYDPQVGVYEGLARTVDWHRKRQY